MTVWIVQLNIKLELMSDLDASGVGILKTFLQTLWQIQFTRDFEAFGFLAHDLQLTLFVDLIFVPCNCLRGFVVIMVLIEDIRIECKVVAFD